MAQKLSYILNNEGMTSSQGMGKSFSDSGDKNNNFLSLFSIFYLNALSINYIIDKLFKIKKLIENETVFNFFSAFFYTHKKLKNRGKKQI